jgi:hypothetical protein
MKRTRFARRGGHTRDADTLARLAQGLGASGSRIEDAYWEHRLSTEIDRLLASEDDAVLEAALDLIYRESMSAYDAFADLIEARAEARSVMTDDKKLYDVLVFAAPILTWSRYAIPSGRIGREVLTDLRTHLQAHVLGKETTLTVADFLYSPDQLPQGFADTHQLAEALVTTALAGRDLKISAEELPATNPFLADVRYLLGAVAAPVGEALFRWQEDDGSREHALTQWRAQGAPVVQKLMPGCAFELLAPDAYWAAGRRADRQARPYSLRASVEFLRATLSIEPKTLTAVVAPFHDRQLEEFRIGFMHQSEADVLHGVVWPLLDAEDETSDSIGQIEAVLREAGVTEFTSLEQQFPLEFCDDCGAPLYPNAQGETVHAEMPEQAPNVSTQLH